MWAPSPPAQSWSDDGRAKYKALTDWARHFQLRCGRTPTLWLDKACIDQQQIDESLAVLPIFLSGCAELLVLAGPSYHTRLWCIVELFTFLWMGGSIARICIKPIAATTATQPGALRNQQTELTRSLLREFDVELAECFKPEDQQHLLGVIEAAFGSFAAFNRVAQETFAQRLQGEAARNGRRWSGSSRDMFHLPRPKPAGGTGSRARWSFAPGWRRSAVGAVGEGAGVERDDQVTV